MEEKNIKYYSISSKDELDKIKLNLEKIYCFRDIIIEKEEIYNYFFLMMRCIFSITSFISSAATSFSRASSILTGIYTPFSS